MSTFILISPTSALSSGTFDANVKVRPSLTLNITSSGTAVSDIILNLDPASNPYDSKELNITVGTNNQTGYVLTMSTANGSSNLVNVADNTKIIPTLSQAAGSTPSTLSDNTWGYKKDTGNYIPFTTTTILSNNTRTNEDSTTLTFAAKVDYTKPSGLYEQDLVFAATPNMATYYIQDLDPVLCTEEPLEVIDSRDGRTYWVAKLEDGNCWMLQNLRLGQNTTSLALDDTTSNVQPTGFTLKGKLSDGKFTYSTIDGTQYQNNSSQYYCTTDYGCYYNWYTATAGSGTSYISVDNTDTNYSICPKGWIVPNSSQFSSLINAYDSLPSVLLVNPTNLTENTTGQKPGFLLGGGMISGGPNGVGSSGVYWARNAYSAEEARGFTITTNSVGASGHNRKYVGRPVRCLRETRKIYDIDNMQDMSPAIASNTNIGSATTLTDTRDNNEYTVAKLKDGKVWMTQNLRLGTNSSSVTLTPMNSNISAASWTLNGKVASPGKFTTYTTCAVGSCEDRYTSTTYYNDNNAFYCTPVSGDTNQYVGCYYDWYSATAGSGTSSVTPVGGSVGYKDVNSSICPKGWFLPSGGGAPLSGSTSDRPNSDFNVLYDNYPSPAQIGNLDTCAASGQAGCDNASGTNTPSFLLSGYYGSGGADDLGQNGRYWSRSAYSKGFAYYLRLNSSAVLPQSYTSKYHGFSVRCLAYGN